ncbi:unnamed protein product [Absidia cylindrospora]
MSSALIESSSTQALKGSDTDIDALPYIDQEIDEPEMKASVDQLIEQEMRHNQVLSQEWDRVGKKLNLTALDETRYELQGPDSDTMLKHGRRQ